MKLLLTHEQRPIKTLEDAEKEISGLNERLNAVIELINEIYEVEVRVRRK